MVEDFQNLISELIQVFLVASLDTSHRVKKLEHEVLDLQKFRRNLIDLTLNTHFLILNIIPYSGEDG